MNISEMKEDVTVVADDSLIIVDGEGIEFQYGIQIPKRRENLWALQWHRGIGELELKGEDNQTFDETAYELEVLPFVEQWEAERKRLAIEEERLKQAEEAEWNRPENVAERARNERDILLGRTDYLMMPDYPLSDEDRESVAAYRQALRDLTSQKGWPMDIKWPETPSILQ